MAVRGNRRLLLRTIHPIKVPINFPIFDRLDNLEANWMELEHRCQIVDIICENSDIGVLLLELGNVSN
jgi:hypothetical protein